MRNPACGSFGATASAIIQARLRAGASFDFAEDGQSCLEMVSSSPPDYYDLILMDICMPKMDGLDATKKLRRMGCSLPIIAMTANVSEQDRNAEMEAGMNAFAEKPIFIEKLFALMTKYLQEKPDKS
ncbi:MAG: response regulator [Clostridia bacterium]|nr:response regulator [Clostridia bacterium]